MAANLNFNRSDLLNNRPVANRPTANVSAEKSCQAIFQEKIGIRNATLFEIIWRQAIDLHCIRFDQKVPLSSLIAKIDAAIADTLVYHGQGVDFTIDAKSDASRIVKYLLGKGDSSPELFNRAYLKSLVVRKDSQSLKKVRDGLRQALFDCSRHLPEKNSKEEKVFEAFVGNVVAMIPYNYPKIGEEYVIPMHLNGEWKVCKYRVDQRIGLTYQWFSSPINAYGLISKEGPPILTFLGTTCPTGRGFVATLLADFTPGHSVGLAPYLQGKRKIAEWLKDKNDVRLLGSSLGGALAFHVARHHPEKISRADVYNPPGLYPWNWGGEAERLPEMNIYYQYNDLVSTLGFYPSGKKVSVYRVIGNMAENFVKAHLRAYTGSEKVTILKSSATFENSRPVRKFITLLHFLFAYLVFIPVLLIHVFISIQILIFSRSLSLATRLSFRYTAINQALPAEIG